MREETANGGRGALRALRWLGVAAGLTLTACASDGPRGLTAVAGGQAPLVEAKEKPQIDPAVKDGVARALKAIGQMGSAADPALLIGAGVGAGAGIGGAGTEGDEDAERDDAALEQARREAQLEALEQWLEPREESVHGEVLDFYATRDWTPAWVTSTEGRKRARALIGSACGVTGEGLDPSGWSLDEALARLEALERTDADGEGAVPAALEAELALTATFLRIVDDARHGQHDPASVRWLISREDGSRASPHRLLGALAHPERPPDARLPRPAHPQYARLLKARHALETVRARGGWPEVTPGSILKPGDEGPRVVELRRRLAASGELGEHSDTPVFDDALAEALKRFQRNRGLDEDGLVGTATLAALREPVEAQLERIAVNLERLRWLPWPIEGRHLVVNLPDYTLEAKEGARTLFTSPVVVGVEDWQTPIMVSNIVRVEVNPRWTVPPRMAREKIFPKYQASPEEAARGGMRVIDNESGEEVDPVSVDWEAAEPGRYRLVQRPGPGNPMGEVKLPMDNRLMIYLHGTNEPRAFEQSRRALSHGCVRVQALDEVSRFALPEEAHARYAQAREGRRETTLKLDTPLPVYFVYFTAWVDDDGTLQQREDVYGQDARLAKTMRPAEPAEAPRACR